MARTSRRRSTSATATRSSAARRSTHTKATQAKPKRRISRRPVVAKRAARRAVRPRLARTQARRPRRSRASILREPVATRSTEPISAAASPPSYPAPPAGGSRSIEERFVIPTGYGDHRIVLMVKDPWWVYAYWEVQPHIERQARSQLSPEETIGLRSVLRVYDVTDRRFPEQAAHSWFDVALSGLAANWYLHTNAPNHSFVVDIGLLTRSGRFLTLARSNRVTTPRFGPSDIIDEEWMIADEDYWKLFGITAGVGMGSSPSALRALLERNLASQALFSPGLFSPVKAPAPKAFALHVDTELVVHGSTDPKASVSIQGQPVKLNTDGTFNVRMALPDGTQTIPVEAVSFDRQHTRTVTTTVTRQTEGQPAARAAQTDQPPATRPRTRATKRSDV